MRNLFAISSVMSLVFGLQACKLIPTQTSDPVEKNITKAQMAIQNDIACESIANAVKPMVSLKWANRDAVKTGESKTLADSRMLSMVNQTAFKEIGFSIKETQLVAEQVLAIDISNEMEYDMLSYHNFYKAQCELEKENIAVLPLVDVAPMLDKCWFPVHNKGVDPEVCFKQVLSGELTL